MAFDGFGRRIDYLRISVTDRCNLRCLYCMPEGPLSYLPGEDLLCPAEIRLVVRAALGAGFRKFRLTGGEPLLRRDLAEIVRGIDAEIRAASRGEGDLCLTTNGLLLPMLLPDLMEAGLRRVNVHVDSLHAGRLKALMRRNSLPSAWDGILAADRAGLRPLKLNAVVTRGSNDRDVVDMARLTLERDWHVRFIELMPLGDGECSRVARDAFVPTAETMDRIQASLGPLEPLPSADPSDESTNFRLGGAPGVVGFISPVSRPYCGTCNRMRLTANGRFHLCLLHDDQVDVRAALREGGVEEVRRVLLLAVGAKPTGHALSEGIYTRGSLMHQIGG